MAWFLRWPRLGKHSIGRPQLRWSNDMRNNQTKCPYVKYVCVESSMSNSGLNRLMMKDFTFSTLRFFFSLFT